LSSLYSPANCEAFVLANGINQIHLETRVAERLDKVMASLETDTAVCGNGTMLIVGNSVLKSRMALQDTRNVIIDNPVTSVLQKSSVGECCCKIYASVSSG
jgi:hypothetical protein